VLGVDPDMSSPTRKPRNGTMVLPVDPVRALARSQVPIDRRNLVMTRDEAIARVRSDFFELPGLKLTVAQAARLWAVGHDLALSILEDLTAGGFLIRIADQYARR
jgi:hypothetical protein